jgi:aspartate/methionine/tyrosine aminotransferase
MRIGWIATKDKEVQRRAWELKDYIVVSASRFDEFFGALALRHADSLLARNRAIARANLEVLDAFFERNKDLFSWVRPQAGTVGLIRYLNGRDTHPICEDAMAKNSVLLASSTLFDAGNNHFRIGFGRANMPEALERFEAYISAHLRP